MTGGGGGANGRKLDRLEPRSYSYTRPPWSFVRTRCRKALLNGCARQSRAVLVLDSSLSGALERSGAHMKQCAAALAAAVSVAFAAACGGSRSTVVQAAAAATFAPTDEISADELRRDLFVFASDSFRGRETGTPDATRAASFIADRLMDLGLEPAGDSMYMQRI